MTGTFYSDVVVSTNPSAPPTVIDFQHFWLKCLRYVPSPLVSECFYPLTPALAPKIQHWSGSTRDGSKHVCLVQTPTEIQIVIISSISVKILKIV